MRRELGVSEQTDHRWRNRFGGLKVDDATLKRLLAEAGLEKAALKELTEGDFQARAGAAPPSITSSTRCGWANGWRAVRSGSLAPRIGARSRATRPRTRTGRLGTGSELGQMTIPATGTGGRITTPAARGRR